MPASAGWSDVTARLPVLPALRIEGPCKPSWSVPCAAEEAAAKWAIHRGNTRRTLDAADPVSHLCTAHIGKSKMRPATCQVISVVQDPRGVSASRPLVAQMREKPTNKQCVNQQLTLRSRRADPGNCESHNSVPQISMSDYRRVHVLALDWGTLAKHIVRYEHSDPEICNLEGTVEDLEALNLSFSSPGFFFAQPVTSKLAQCCCTPMLDVCENTLDTVVDISDKRCRLGMPSVSPVQLVARTGASTAKRWFSKDVQAWAKLQCMVLRFNQALTAQAKSRRPIINVHELPAEFVQYLGWLVQQILIFFIVACPSEHLFECEFSQIHSLVLNNQVACKVPLVYSTSCLLHVAPHPDCKALALNSCVSPAERMHSACIHKYARQRQILQTSMSGMPLPALVFNFTRTQGTQKSNDRLPRCRENFDCMVTPRSCIPEASGTVHSTPQLLHSIGSLKPFCSGTSPPGLLMRPSASTHDTGSVSLVCSGKSPPGNSLLRPQSAEHDQMLTDQQENSMICADDVTLGPRTLIYALNTDDEFDDHEAPLGPSVPTYNLLEGVEATPAFSAQLFSICGDDSAFIEDKIGPTIVDKACQRIFHLACSSLMRECLAKMRDASSGSCLSLSAMVPAACQSDSNRKKTVVFQGETRKYMSSFVTLRHHVQGEKVGLNQNESETTGQCLRDAAAVATASAAAAAAPAAHAAAPAAAPAAHAAHAPAAAPGAPSLIDEDLCQLQAPEAVTLTDTESCVLQARISIKQLQAMAENNLADSLMQSRQRYNNQIASSVSTCSPCSRYPTTRTSHADGIQTFCGLQDTYRAVRMPPWTKQPRRVLKRYSGNDSGPNLLTQRKGRPAQRAAYASQGFTGVGHSQGTVKIGVHQPSSLKVEGFGSPCRRLPVITQSLHQPPTVKHEVISFKTSYTEHVPVIHIRLF